MGESRDEKLQVLCLGPSRPVVAVTWLEMTFAISSRWLCFSFHTSAAPSIAGVSGNRVFDRELIVGRENRHGVVLYAAQGELSDAPVQK